MATPRTPHSPRPRESTASTGASSPHASSPHTYQSFDDLVASASSPTTPTRAHFRSRTSSGGGAAVAPHDPDAVALPVEHDDPDEVKPKDSLSTLDLVKLTLGIAGAQLAWTVEMAYGTPYLLGLGLTKQGTSLVWMAGPLSGLIVQPVVGALSDASPSRYRRRRYVVLSTAFILISTLVVAYAREISSLLVSIFTGVGDWDPAREDRERTGAIILGVAGFYVLDFSLNGLQASLRALALDLSPVELQSTSNAWLGRQTHVANVVGYLVGILDLGHSPLLRWLGGGQFRKLAVISCAVMVVTVGVTCATQHEQERPELRAQESAGAWKKVKGVVRDVVVNVKQLPRPVRRVCFVQFFAWTAWFPFLFYSSTYVAEAYYSSLPRGTPRPPADEATRAGSFALLIYAIVSLAAGAIIPFLTEIGFSFPSLPSRVGPAGRFALSLITPRNAWTIGLAWYTFCILATFWTKSVVGATLIVAFVGVPWAITCWVPYALVMEAIREVETAANERAARTASPASSAPGSPFDTPTKSFASPPAQRSVRAPFRVTSLRQASFTVPHDRASSSSPLHAASTAAAQPADERTALLPRTHQPKAPPAIGGGTILGLHNLAIVLPQLFIAVVSAGIFRLTSRAASRALGDGGGGEGELGGHDDVVWVLRFGGLASFLGVFASRWLEETTSERRYREWVLYGWEEEDRASQ
ncbi:hypothetical protein Rhopal_002848-T1 [Rhodotorula paludigena]|uniref:General alpha-glucoside permease n=1 Tax=Rhodotorula paludigena TaxID=86838 RepID=A0AAV5GHB0_9BASI|nr:hypothetical protein Rhopal_002848-T1 [Rhodotorula paludigena]